MGNLLYNHIVRQVGIRINAISGALPATLEADYIAAPVTAFQSTIFPKTAIYDAIRLAEERMAQVIAAVGNQTLRVPLLTISPALANGDSMRTVESIGQYGSVLDADDQSIVCTAASPQEIRRYWKLSTYLKLPQYLYSLDGNGIFHTRPNGVVVQFCAYDGDAQATAIAENRPILLADSLEEGYVNGALAELLRDDEFSQQAAVYRGYFNETLAGIRSAFTSQSPVAAPGPVVVETTQ